MHTHTHDMEFPQSFKAERGCGSHLIPMPHFTEELISVYAITFPENTRQETLKATQRGVRDPCILGLHHSIGFPFN